ncbi:MAG TPA: YitT family protein [Thermotogota bacterium]|nr:YitT family protein [Thermotogota bacterium]HPJ90148.1 YitT family protein [Thermotogota bacterium]HPR97327.1 YitT family protein [Thermotogota bacterium]
MKKTVLREYILSTIGATLTAIGLVSFLIPHNIACGGASGIAIVLSNFVDIPIGVLLYFINGILFLVSFLVIGKEFGIRSLYCTFLLNFLIDFFDRIVPIPAYTGNDLFLTIFFGVVISAVGMAITFSQNSSTGGTDIIARILNKYFGTAMGTSLLLIDLFVGLAAGVAFNPTIGMYSIVGVILNGLTIDYIIKMIDNHITLTIISNKEDEIVDYITNKLKRGASFIKGEGVYTATEKNMVYVALKRKEMGEIIRHIRTIDQKAFIIAQEASHVIGEGFKNITKIF